MEKRNKIPAVDNLNEKSIVVLKQTSSVIFALFFFVNIINVILIAIRKNKCPLNK